MRFDDAGVAEFLREPIGMFLDGQWRSAASNATADVRYPASGEIIAHVADGSSEDVAVAVEAAVRAFELGSWSRERPDQRSNMLLALASLVERDRETLAVLETLETGKPIREARGDIARGLDGLRFYAATARNLRGETISVDDEAFHSYTTLEPVGVVAAIVPWNVPFVLAVSKAAPALAGGNSVVVKPSQSTPLTALYLARLAQEAGLPKGVFNVVTGSGARVGEPLCLHPDVTGITFTGSTATGLHLGVLTAASNKRTMLELGGKSPNIVLADADLSRAIPGAASAIFYGQGQICSAGSRLLVDRTIHDRVVEGVAACAASLRIGDPLDPDTEMGALMSESHLERVLGMVADAVAAGATLISGGVRIRPTNAPNGAFMRPTILDNVLPDSVAVREEIFGPVLVVQEFSGVEEAIQVANATRFGLAAGVWTQDHGMAKRIARRLHAGVIWINDYNQFNPAMPFGGLGISGTSHKEWSHLAMDAFLEHKAIWERIS